VNYQYSSDRIAAWRGRQLAPDEVKLIDNIQEFGCHILMITEDAGTPAWAYSVGFYDLFRQPEIIVVGLKHRLAQSLLNSVCRRIADGLAELKDMPKGWIASRNYPTEPWVREVHPPEDE
jgi:hypothetical protein